jgi:hypothetical protein
MGLKGLDKLKPRFPIEIINNIDFFIFYNAVLFSKF